MSRRAFVTGLGAVLAAPLGVEAHQASRVYRLGILSPAPSPAPSASLDVISVALGEVGYVEGKNLTIERRYGAGNPASLPRLARELVQLRPDAIVAVSADSIKAAKEATRTVPIVMGFTADPVGQGFISSLSRPGGNITGVAYAVGPEIAAKRVELLREAVPKITRMGILSTHETASQPQVRHARSAASRLGVELIAVDAENNNYDAAFAALVAERVGAVSVAGSPILNRDRKRIIALAAKYQLPAIYEWREHATEGGLMSYGGDISALYRRVADYVGRIFKGANPADLPVEQPTKFELVINLKTAKALGLSIPPSLLLRADQVLE